jgi:hypothetical protein
MRKTILALLMSSLSFCLDAQVSAQLNIPPRIQWPNNDGYCGEMSIQCSGLYYGDYISQGLCRNVAGGEVLVYVNDTLALSTLKLNFVEWDPNPPSPQYKNYFVWVKEHLDSLQPVIITLYVSGLSDPDYDHIVPATGFYAQHVNTYTSTDSLTFNDNFATTPFYRVFSTLYGTRSVANSSAPFPYYVPQNVDYGVAVTGIKDSLRQTRPVHIVLNVDSEPNVTIGMKPVMLKAQIIADSLTIGKSYAMLRYNDYNTLPSCNFSPSNANAVTYFTATAVTKTVIDSFMSDTAVFYRCIPYSATGIAETNVVEDNALVYPNPTRGSFTIRVPENAGVVEVYDISGQLIQKIDAGNKKELEMNLLQPGNYLIRVDCGKTVYVNKVVVVK